MVRSIACVLLALTALASVSARSAPAGCVAGGGDGCSEDAVHKPAVAPTPRPRIEIVRLGDTANEADARIRPLSFREVMALSHLPDSLVNEVVRVDGGYMFSLRSEGGREETLHGLRFASAGVEAPRRDAYRHAARTGSTLLYEEERRHADVWVTSNHDVTFPAPWMLPVRDAAEWNSSAELQTLLQRYLEESLATQSRSESWLHFLPEWSIAWLLVLGLLVVALRRVPLRFRSNGL